MSVNSIKKRIKRLEAGTTSNLPLYVPIISRFGEPPILTDKAECKPNVIIKRFDGSMDPEE